MGLLIYAVAWISSLTFWVFCLFSLFEDIEITLLMLALYLPLGFIFELFVITLEISPNILVSGRLGKRKVRLKAAYKKQIFNNVLKVVGSFFLGLCFWFPLSLFVFHDLNEKRKGAPYGSGGGGYIYKERNWRELLSDEFRGREGKQ